MKRIGLVIVLLALVVIGAPSPAFAATPEVSSPAIVPTVTAGVSSTITVTDISGTTCSGNPCYLFTIARTGTGSGTSYNCTEAITFRSRFIDSTGAYMGSWVVQANNVSLCQNGSQVYGYTIGAGSYGLVVEIVKTSDSTRLGYAKTTSEFEVPDAPVLGCAGTFDGVSLEWTHGGAMAATGFDVQRSPATAGSWAAVKTVGPAVSIWEDRPQPQHLARDYRVRATNGPSAWSNTCTATTGETGTGEDLPTPDVTDPEPGDDEGESCAVWNLFCHAAKALRWAFVPGETTANAWEDFSSTVTSRPPASVVTWAYDFVSAGFDEAGGTSGAGYLVGCAHIPNTGAGTAGDVCIEDAFEQLEGPWVVVRSLIAFAMWGGLAFFFWRQAEGAVRPRSDDPAEVMEE